MIENEKELLIELNRLYLVGAKTFCLTRDQITIVMSLLRDRKRIAEKSEIIKKYIKKELDGTT